MNYDTLIKTVSAIIENPDIYKDTLTLTYTLTEFNHRKMNEDLFYRTHSPNEIFTPLDSFEVDILGILVVFLKKQA